MLLRQLRTADVSRLVGPVPAVGSAPTVVAAVSS